AAAGRRNSCRTQHRAAFCPCAKIAGLLSLTPGRQDLPIMPLSRRVFLVLPLAILAGRRAALAADTGAAPTALVERFYAALLAVMKEAKKLSFDERYKRLAPAIEQA